MQKSSLIPLNAASQATKSLPEQSFSSLPSPIPNTKIQSVLSQYSLPASPELTAPLPVSSKAKTSLLPLQSPSSGLSNIQKTMIGLQNFYTKLYFNFMKKMNSN